MFRNALLALLALIIVGAAMPASALMLYKDPATGAVFVDSAPNRVSAMPWNIDFWGRSFVQWRGELARDPHAVAAGVTASDQRRPYNAFEVTRAYFGLRAPLADWGKFEFLFDFRDQTGAGAAVSSAPTSASGYHAVIKAAFFEINRPFRNHMIRFGQINLPWIGYEESIWPYRLEGTTFADREGYLTSTDRGVGLIGKLPGLEQVDYNVAFVNGEGYNADEVNTGKTVEGRLTWKPSAIPGLQMTGFGDYRRRTSASGGNHQFAFGSREIALIAYTRGPATIAGEYLWTRDPSRADLPAGNRAAIPASVGGPIEGRGFSIFGHYTLPLDLWKGEWKLLGRWDRFDPDLQTSDNAHDREIVGLSFRPNKSLMFLVSYDRTQQEAGASSSTPGTSATAVGRTAMDRDMIQFQTQIDF